MSEGIVNQLEVSVLVSAPAGLHEMQRGLNRLIVHLLSVTIEIVPMLLHALDKEHAVVVTRNGETWLRYHHRLMEPCRILLLQALRSCRTGIVIEGGRNISIILIEALQIVLGIHQPLRIAEERDGCTRELAVELIQPVEHSRQLWRTARVQNNHILLTRLESLGKLLQAGIHIGDAVVDVTLLQFLAESVGKDTLSRCRV